MIWKEISVLADAENHELSSVVFEIPIFAGNPVREKEGLRRCYRSTFIASRNKYMIINEYIKGEEDEYRSSLVPGSDATDSRIIKSSFSGISTSTMYCSLGGMKPLERF